MKKEFEEKDSWNVFFEMDEEEIKYLNQQEFPLKDTKRRKTIISKHKSWRKKAAILKNSEKSGLGLVRKGDHFASKKGKRVAKKFAHRKERKIELGNGRSYRAVKISSPEMVIKDRNKVKSGDEPLCRFVLQI